MTETLYYAIREHSDSTSIPTFLLSCTDISLCENNETHPTRTTDQRGTTTIIHAPPLMAGASKANVPAC